MYDEHRDLLSSYRSAIEVLRTLVDGPAAVPPSEGEWSVPEIVSHLADAEERQFGRVRRIVAEDHPFLPVFEDSDHTGVPLGRSLERFGRLRSEQVAFLESLQAADWARTGTHEVEGDVSIETITRHMAAHDVEHLAQIGRLIGAV